MEPYGAGGVIERMPFRRAESAAGVVGAPSLPGGGGFAQPGGHVGRRQA